MTDYERRLYEQAKPAYAALMKVYPFTLDDLDGEIWLPVPDYPAYQSRRKTPPFRAGDIRHSF